MKMPVGDLATWVTGIATILLFATAFWQIHTERSERLAREKVARRQEKQAQAEQVSSWIVKETGSPLQAWTAILNHSSQPIYQVVVSIVGVQGAGPHDGLQTPHEYRVCVSAAPPGEVYASVPATYHGHGFHPGIEIAFKDAAGKCWVRKVNGDLSEIDKSPIDYYNILRPLSWHFPMRDIPQDKIDEVYQPAKDITVGPLKRLLQALHSVCFR